MSMLCFGVRMRVRPSSRAPRTAFLTPLNPLIVLPSRETATLLQSFSAISEATFLLMRSSLNCASTGSRSDFSSAREPVMLWRYEKMPLLPDFFLSLASSSSSPSLPTSQLSTSATPDPRYSFSSWLSAARASPGLSVDLSNCPSCPGPAVRGSQLRFFLPGELVSSFFLSFLTKLRCFRSPFLAAGPPRESLVLSSSSSSSSSPFSLSAAALSAISFFCCGVMMSLAIAVSENCF
mmetsp:Transcript_37765/g.89346  ORF Transcript_37765/g.89346 Transcript_37765/m.89346 type:complete len:236 (-) Transcript_37765:569-1276(-)